MSFFLRSTRSDSTLADKQVSLSSSAKFLGLEVDCNLNNWKVHVQSVAGISSSAFFALRTISTSANPQTLIIDLLWILDMICLRTSEELDDFRGSCLDAKKVILVKSYCLCNSVMIPDYHFRVLSITN